MPLEIGSMVSQNFLSMHGSRLKVEISILGGFSESQVKHVQREGNYYVDKLANKAVLSRSPSTHFDVLPSFVRACFFADYNGIDYWELGIFFPIPSPSVLSASLLQKPCASLFVSHSSFHPSFHNSPHMDALLSLKLSSFQALPSLSSAAPKWIPPSPHQVIASRRNPFSAFSLRSQMESTDVSAAVAPSNDSAADVLKIKEWEVGMFQDEVAASQGIRIRRRPPSGPPLHYVGPFEFRLQNEGNTPRNILEEIVWNKDKEVAQLKERKPLIMLKKALENAPPARDFIGSLRAANERTGFPGLIAEVKKASPSRGVLREDFDPVEIAQAYEKGGAACLSVLTDEKYFKGSFENLELIRKAGVKCPLLCKEFIIDAWQLYYARTKGADAVLLIAAVLPDLDIKYMVKICKMLGLTALVEVHDEKEFDRVLGIEGIELIGINNRNLETFEVDIGITKKLLEGERGRTIREKDIIIVGESGLFTPDDIAFVQEAGVKAVLVGESIVKQSDPGKGISNLFGKDISQV
ncbi:indole-3-glycerol phosphate synthase, chloroplastic-like isoform X1 [Senna tora]|uniref:indole-3-glycerol-phosphate synthase n=1 Tax=Senna tora TaxID=362788 RepID=A0A835C550_9FABA|nr:indole-3-glycerol phosphate synthase, chloroplastic-like isoform X1 [Senna tora]